jgi:hypothetical protein
VKDDAFYRAVKRTKLPKRYVEYLSELPRADGMRRWHVRLSDPTGGQRSGPRILTEDGELLAAG